MDEKIFRGERLKKARLFRGMTLTEMAALTDISKQSLSQYENGSKPDYERGTAIAKALGFPYEYFLQKDSYSTVSETTYFRSLASATKIDRIAQSTKLEFVANIYHFLSQYLEFPILNLPEVEFKGTEDEFDEYAYVAMLNEVEQIAISLRKHWRLSDEPVENIQLLLEENGIIITGFDTNEDKIDAFSQRTVSGKTEVFFIAVDQGTKPEGRIRFDMAHELGHILLHPWSENVDLIPKEEFKMREKQANLFAGEFLLPRKSFGVDVKAYPTDLNYYLWLKKKWKCSAQAMIYRSNQLDIISDNQFQYLMRQVSKRGWRLKEPDDVPFFLNENIFQGAFDLLFEHRIFTPESVMRNLKQYGITLFPRDIENLLCLRKGMLDVQTNQGHVVELKLLKKE